MANIRMIYGKRYDLDNPQEAAEALRVQRQVQLEGAAKRLLPNQTGNQQIKLNAANLLAQDQSLLNARAGVPPVSPNTYNVLSQNNGLLDVAPPPAQRNQQQNNAANLLNLSQPNSRLSPVNINTSGVGTAIPPQPAQPQPKKTLGQRASGLLDNVSNAYMNAAPMFAVANEFTKAGALRPIGGQIQGDPYGKMVEVQQTKQQSKDLANLRQDPQYAQFANLPTEQFLQAVEQQNKFVIENQLTSSNTYANIDTNVSSEGLMTQLNETKKPIVLSEYEERAHGNSEMAHGIENTAALIAGSISVPFTSRNLAKKTEEARSATVDYFNEVRGILVDAVGGRVTVFDKKAVNNQLPAEFRADGSISSYSSEGEALAKYQGLKGALTGQLKDAIALTQDPNTRDDKTVMRKANSKIDKLRRAIRMTDIRIDSLNQERQGDDAFYGERDDLFENPIDTSGRIGMTEEQAEEIFFSDLDTTFE